MALPAGSSGSSGSSAWSGSPGSSGSSRAPRIVIVMGVSGSGKTTIGRALAAGLGCDFQEGDDLHPPANRAKLRAGIPLDDDDRAPWLAAVAAWIDRQRQAGRDAVISCSALKRAYRAQLRRDRPEVRMIYLRAAEATIAERIRARTHAFMPASLLHSQFETLEAPQNEVGVDVIDVDTLTPEQTVQLALVRLKPHANSGNQAIMKIGFIGLGAMGQGIANNLLKAGHELTVWNRSASAADELVRAGARRAALAAEVCGSDASTRADAVFVMLADDRALQNVMDAGLLAALQAPTVLVNLATISVAYARTLAAAVTAQGAAYVAAPVFGRPDMAAAAQLNLVVSGADDAVTRVRPALDAIGKKVWPAGEAPERANVIKIAGNFMLASAIESMAEASAFTRAHGIEAADFLAIMTQTLFAAPAYVGYGKLIAEQRYQPAGFKMALGLKDVELALQAAGQARVPMPFASAVRDALLDALAHGGADKDWSALAEVASRRAGLDE